MFLIIYIYKYFPEIFEFFFFFENYKMNKKINSELPKVIQYQDIQFMEELGRYAIRSDQIKKYFDTF